MECGTDEVLAKPSSAGTMGVLPHLGLGPRCRSGDGGSLDIFLGRVWREGSGRSDSLRHHVDDRGFSRCIEHKHLSRTWRSGQESSADCLACRCSTRAQRGSAQGPDAQACRPAKFEHSVRDLGCLRSPCGVRSIRLGRFGGDRDLHRRGRCRGLTSRDWSRPLIQDSWLKEIVVSSLQDEYFRVPLPRFEPYIPCPLGESCKAPRSWLP